MSDLTREDVAEHLRNKVSLELADLQDLDLRGLDFAKTNLYRANLCGCRLAGSRFHECNLSSAKLEEADLSSCNLSNANLSKANFHKALLFEANLANVKAVGADFRSADLSQADCSTADFGKCDFRRAKCCTTDFRNTVLAEADFRDALLRGALFRGANLHDARWEGALGIEPGLPLEAENTKKEHLAGIGLGIIGSKPVVNYNALRIHTDAPKQEKASKYHPPLRCIPAVIFTTGGWIRGVFHVPIMHGFLEYINLEGGLLKLTHVTLPYLNLDLRFFGLKRSKALLMLPDCDPKLLHLPEPTADYHVHRVSFLLEGGTVTGSLAIEEDIRVSDYLANHDQFVVLRNCRFGAHDSPQEEESHFPLLMVNCQSVVGASDERLR